MARNTLIDGSLHISLAGDKELDHKLATLSGRVQRRLIKKAVGFAGRRIRKDMRDHVPVDEGVLKKSIGTKTKTFKDGNTLLVVGPRKGFVAENGERADKYAIGIEHGWRGREPIPFARTAYERGKATVVEDFQAGLGNGIEKEALKSG
jgi:HK97 gp10 family phage protein